MIPEAASTSSFIHPLILHSKTKHSLNVYYIAGTGGTTLLKTNQGNLCPPWASCWHRWKRIYLFCRRCGYNPWVGKTAWRKKRQPTPMFLPGEFHRQRSLVDCSPPGSSVYEILQCSCLENFIDRGAWWAAVHGVAESQIRHD